MKNIKDNKQIIEPISPKSFISYHFIIPVMAVLQVCARLYGLLYIDFF
jgi:hypothetical protein